MFSGVSDSDLKFEFQANKECNQCAQLKMAKFEDEI